MDKKIFFVYNPVAGRGINKSKILEIVEYYSKCGFDVTIYPTSKRYDAKNSIIKACEDKYERIICCGGDGTLDEVVEGMMEIPVKKRLPIGYIPTGTTNDFASSLNIPLDIIKASKVAIHGEKFNCDIGRFNSKPFVYIAAFGLFTDLSYDVSQNLKNALGHAAYVISAVKKLSQIKSYNFKIITKKKIIEDQYIYGCITNSKSVGGFRNFIHNHLVKFDDGKFEITLIKMPKNIVELNNILQALLFKNSKSKYIDTFKAKEIFLTTDTPTPWTIDGEYGGKHQNVEIHNINKQIMFIVPKEKISELLSLSDDELEMKNKSNIPEEV